MPTRSPELIPTSATATPAAAGSVALLSTARAEYVQQKRDFTAHRGAEIIGPGVAVPRITCADALALVAWWSREVPALASRLEAGASAPEIAAWARCTLAVRAVASAPVAAGAGDRAYPDAFRLWRCIKQISTAMDAHAVAPRNAGAELAVLASEVMRAADRARASADNASQAINKVSDALASGAAKVSGAAGRGAGEGAIKGALSAAAVPAALIGGAALVGGLVWWRVASHNDNKKKPDDEKPKRATSKPSKAKRAKKSGGRS